MPTTFFPKLKSIFHVINNGHVTLFTTAKRKRIPPSFFPSSFKAVVFGSEDRNIRDIFELKHIVGDVRPTQPLYFSPPPTQH